MSRLRVPCELPDGDRCDLEGDAARYLLRARRAAVGDRFVAFDPIRAVEADAVLVAATRSTATLELSARRAASVLPRRPATLLQAVGKGDKLDAIVRDATELGATRVIPIATSRSVPRRDAAAMTRRLERVAVEAARQSGRGDVPRIDPPGSLQSALLGLDASVRIALVPGGRTPFAEAIAAVAGPSGVAFAVGPEGGFDDVELEALASAGFVPTNLGPVILRTETACAAVLGALLARL